MPQHHRYLPAEDRRKDLLDAAGRLFATGGFDALTMAAVAREAGVSRALVYQYFPDQDTLATGFFDDRITSYFAAIDATLDPSGTPLARALAAVRQLLLLAPSDLYAVHAIIASHGDQRLSPIRARLRETTVRRWETFLRPDSDRRAAGVAAEVLAGTVVTLAIAVRADELTIEQADRLLTNYIVATVDSVNR